MNGADRSQSEVHANQKWGIHTIALHAGENASERDVASPIRMSTTFRFQDAEEAAQAFALEDRPIYTRWGNPTLAVLEDKVAALEGAEAGLATASGMAAISTALLTVLASGDHLVATNGLYSGTYHFLAHDMPRLGIEVTLAEASSPEAFEAAIRPTTRAIFLESPGNPTLALNDLEAIVSRAGPRGIMTFIDNTFASPYNQLPLSLGVDVAIHSATKFLGGHGDALGGIIVGKRDFIEQSLRGPLRHLGGTISPFNAWLIARGVQTLPLRMKRHNDNALAVATWLAEHPAVKRVRYPWHPSHPQFELARRQMPNGGGGVVVFDLQGGMQAGIHLLNRANLCVRTVSLGNTLTLITHPASTTHRSVPREVRHRAGIGDGLVRLAVGLEDAKDIIADLEQALGQGP